MTIGYERFKRWKENHPERAKEIAKEYCKRWRENNLEEQKKYQREYYKTHPETIRRGKEKYYNKNKGNDTNKRQPYTTEEVNLILNKNFSDIELAKILKRSVKAIQAARYKYKNG